VVKSADAAADEFRERYMKTAITEMFGIEHPIIQGGMHYVGFCWPRKLRAVMT
jgi:hypothetical protein